MALNDVLAAPVVRPVFVGWLDVKDDPLRGWTGPGAFAPSGTGDDDLDGNTFLEIEGAIAVSPISQDLGIGGPITITFPVIEATDSGWVWGQAEWGVSTWGVSGGSGFTQLISDRRQFMGRKAKLWLFFLSDDEGSVLPEFEVLFNGVMVGADYVRQPGRPEMIQIRCDQDLQKASFPPVRWIDHQQFHPGDTASTFINSLSRGPLATAERGPDPWRGFRSWIDRAREVGYPGL